MDNESPVCKVGDLVGWNGEHGGPPWYVDEVWKNATHGIIYRIITAEGTLGDLISYMVYWNNDMIFPAWHEELVLICAGEGPKEEEENDGQDS